MTAGPQFPEYSFKYSQSALTARKKLSGALLTTLDDIAYELAANPDTHQGRIVPASRDGKTFLYLHPDPELQITFERDEEEKVIYFFHFSAPAFEVKKTIFVSYSHEDEEWLATLRKFLTVLEQQGVIEFWDDEKIKAADKWREEIDKSLDGAKAALLLVSQSFLASEFINTVELPKILADKAGKKVFWIPLSPSTVFDTHKEITEFQSLVKNPQTSLEELETADRKKQLVQITKKLSEAILS